MGTVYDIADKNAFTWTTDVSNAQNVAAPQQSSNKTPRTGSLFIFLITMAIKMISGTKNPNWPP